MKKIVAAISLFLTTVVLSTNGQIGIQNRPEFPLSIYRVESKFLKTVFRAETLGEFKPAVHAKVPSSFVYKITVYVKLRGRVTYWDKPVGLRCMLPNGEKLDTILNSKHQKLAGETPFTFTVNAAEKGEMSLTLGTVSPADRSITPIPGGEGHTTAKVLLK
jgi:hypothetical protein